MNTPAVAATRPPALQQVLEDLEAERYRPVPPPPSPTPDERDASAQAREIAAALHRHTHPETTAENGQTVGAAA